MVRGVACGIIGALLVCTSHFIGAITVGETV